MARLQFFPWTSGRYDVSPSLKAFGTDFGNDEMDRQFFPEDEESGRAIQEKSVSLREDVEKYVGQSRLSPEVELAVAAWVAKESGREGIHLSDLMPQVAEDIAIVRSDGESDWIAYLHLCSPSHWAMSDKIGHSFFTTHVPVPGIERVNAAAAGLVRAMIHGGPRVRFVWTVESDDHFNHHPSRPKGRDFAGTGRFWVRWERQVTVGFPELGAAAFLIRVGFCDDHAILADQHRHSTLIQALDSMSRESRRYKGLTDETFDDLMQLLEKTAF